MRVRAGMGAGYQITAIFLGMKVTVSSGLIATACSGCNAMRCALAWNDSLYL